MHLRWCKTRFEFEQEIAYMLILMNSKFLDDDVKSIRQKLLDAIGKECYDENNPHKLYKDNDLLNNSSCPEISSYINEVYLIFVKNYKTSENLSSTENPYQSPDLVPIFMNILSYYMFWSDIPADESQLKSQLRFQSRNR
ncbi:hypothetical protein TKK_0012421 [Trichogramma kaykai]